MKLQKYLADGNKNVTFGTISKKVMNALNTAIAVLYAKAIAKDINVQIEISEEKLEEFQNTTYPNAIRENMETANAESNKLSTDELQNAIQAELNKISAWKPLQLAKEYLKYYTDIESVKRSDNKTFVLSLLVPLVKYANISGGLTAMETDEYFHVMLQAAANKLHNMDKDITFEETNECVCKLYNDMFIKKTAKKYVTKLALSKIKETA